MARLLLPIVITVWVSSPPPLLCSFVAIYVSCMRSIRALASFLVFFIWVFLPGKPDIFGGLGLFGRLGRGPIFLHR